MKLAAEAGAHAAAREVACGHQDGHPWTDPLPRGEPSAPEAMADPGWWERERAAKGLGPRRLETGEPGKVGWVLLD